MSLKRCKGSSVVTAGVVDVMASDIANHKKLRQMTGSPTKDFVMPSLKVPVDLLIQNNETEGSGSARKGWSARSLKGVDIDKFFGETPLPKNMKKLPTTRKHHDYDLNAYSAITSSLQEWQWPEPPRTLDNRPPHAPLSTKLTVHPCWAALDAQGKKEYEDSLGVKKPEQNLGDRPQHQRKTFNSTKRKTEGKSGKATGKEEPKSPRPNENTEQRKSDLPDKSRIISRVTERSQMSPKAGSRSPRDSDMKALEI